MNEYKFNLEPNKSLDGFKNVLFDIGIDIRLDWNKGGFSWELHYIKYRISPYKISYKSL